MYRDVWELNASAFFPNMRLQLPPESFLKGKDLTVVWGTG